MREWPYKDIKPRIIAEQYMEDNASGELRDYKFFCFDGKVKALFIASDRMTQEKKQNSTSSMPITTTFHSVTAIPTPPYYRINL